MELSGWVKSMRVLVALLLALAWLFAPGPVQAQGVTCPYATLRLESRLAVDAKQVCEAAAPWAAKGFRVLVYLTDDRDPSEQAWFARLDRVEAEAGLRDLSQVDFYDRNGLTVAASTDTFPPWGFNITYGETLYGTRLDTADHEYQRLRAEVRELLRQGDPSQALVVGLQQSYRLAYPPPPSPWPLLGVGASAAAVIGGTIYWRRQRRRRQLQNQIQVLQAPVATLLLALEGLLPSDKPEETIFYRLYLISGGERYPQLGSRLLETLQACRQALTQAFWVQGQLSNQTPTTLRELEQQVEAWERLYVSLVGSRERLLNLSEEQLQTLLNPVQFLPSDLAEEGGSLLQQLEDLRQQLEGRPLKVELLRVDPSHLDADGILGLIDRVQRELDRLQKAPALLSAKLATLENRLRQAPTGIPTSLRSGLAGLLNQVRSLQQRGLDLDGLELAEAGIRLLDLLAQLQTWQNQGYRFPRQADDLAQLASALGSLSELHSAIDRLENHSRAYVQRHQKNQAELSRLQAQLQSLKQRLHDLDRRLSRVYGSFFRHPPEEDRKALEETRRLLLHVSQDGIPAIQRWNSLSEQNFDQAQQEIERVQAALQRCADMLNRLERSLWQAEQEDERHSTVTVFTSPSSWDRDFGRSSGTGSWGSGGGSSGSSGSSSRHSSGGSSSRHSSGGSSRRR